MTRSGRIIPIVLAVGLALLIVVPARGQAPNLARLRDSLMKLDTNQDTVIEESEVPEDGRAAFRTLLKHGDANKDGKLQVQELRALGERVRRFAGVGLKQRFPAMDKDGDGKLSRAEFQGPAPLFDRLDADKDGFVTREEVAKGLPGPANPAGPPPRPAPGTLGPRFKAMDKDGDGKVSRDEFTGRPAMFQRLDADKDGFVTAEELRAFARGNAAARGEDGAAKKEPKDTPASRPAEPTSKP
ncbi:MAG TPA: EF-hand domain-containing protein [Isosphaeraceae bacterium]|jgi:Ca2+-binding EF-hand superfamily protein|nr:EF-hand domain-containing protein [Isosphaeraceae bacterium]